MSIEKYGIIGAGGQARETISFETTKDLAFVALNREYISQENEIDILTPNEDQRETPVIAAVGAPAVKRKLVESWSGDSFTNVISPDAYVDKTVLIGEGCIVSPRAVLTTDVIIGNHVLINIATTISHDCVIGDYVTISPGVHVGGRVQIGKGAFIGIGSVISNDVKIADGVVVGAGAVVVDDADVENGVYVGVPAKLIKTNEGWMDEI